MSELSAAERKLVITALRRLSVPPFGALGSEIDRLYWRWLEGQIWPLLARLVAEDGCDAFELELPDPELRRCERPGCGSRLPEGTRADARFCSPACRAAAHRAYRAPRQPPVMSRFDGIDFSAVTGIPD